MPRPDMNLIVHQIEAQRQTQKSAFANLSSEQRLIEMEALQVSARRGQAKFHPYFHAITQH